MLKYSLPEPIRGQCTQEKYSRWLRAKAMAHVRRDRKRKRTCTVSGYKEAIHAAVLAGGDKDFYTGEPLNWKLISTYENYMAKTGGPKYRKSLALLPTVDHTVDERGRQKFVICSWRVNDAKSDLTLEELYELCELVLRYRDRDKGGRL